MTHHQMVTAGLAALTFSCVALQGLRAEIPQAHRVRAVVLSVEASVRTSLNNHDSYLVRIIPRHGQPFLARMIDDFPSYVAPLPKELLASGVSVSLELRRASFCDESADDDALAAHVSSAGAVDNTKMVLTDSESMGALRCFAVIHDSWKGSGALNGDEWWK